MCSVAILALLGLPTPATALIHFVRGYRCLGRLAASSRERKATRIGVAAEAATGPTEGLTSSGFCEGLTMLNLEEMEAWLDEAGVDRRSGTGGAPAGRLKCFAGRGIGLEATVKLERDSTVRNSECAGGCDSSTHRCFSVRLLRLLVLFCICCASFEDLLLLSSDPFDILLLVYTHIVCFFATCCVRWSLGAYSGDRCFPAASSCQLSAPPRPHSKD